MVTLCSYKVEMLMYDEVHPQVFADFDVEFDAYAKQHLPIVDHTDRGFHCNETVPDDMGHDGTVL